MSRRALRGMVLALIGATCWGFSATCVSWLTVGHGVEVLWLANMRLAVAGVLFMSVGLLRDRDKLKLLLGDRTLLVQLLAYSLIGVFLLQVSYMLAIAYTNPATALLLQELGMPVILIYACIRARRWPNGGEIVAIILALVGVAFIATQGNLGALGISLAGLLWGIVCAFTMAGYNIIPMRLVHECGPYITNGVAMLLTAAVMAPFVRPWENPPALDASGWAVFGGIVLVGTMLAYATYLRGVVEAGPVKASLVGVAEPLSGAVFSALWLGTVFSVWDFAGGVCIIVMMVVVALLK